MIERHHEDLAVADLTGFRCADDGGYHRVDLIFGHRDFDLELGQEVHRVFGAAIDLGMTLLAPEALGFGHGKSMHTGTGKRVPDVVELEWLDDCHDEFHGCPFLGSPWQQMPLDGPCRIGHCPRVIEFKPWA